MFSKASFDKLPFDYAQGPPFGRLRFIQGVGGVLKSWIPIDIRIIGKWQINCLLAQTCLCPFALMQKDEKIKTSFSFLDLHERCITTATRAATLACCSFTQRYSPFCKYYENKKKSSPLMFKKCPFFGSFFWTSKKMNIEKYAVVKYQKVYQNNLLLL